MKTFLKLPIRVTSWEGEDCLFDADNQPLNINMPNKPYQAPLLEIVRIINAVCVTEPPKQKRAKAKRHD